MPVFSSFLLRDAMTRTKLQERMAQSEKAWNKCRRSWVSLQEGKRTEQGKAIKTPQP